MTFYDRNLSPWNKRAKWSRSINGRPTESNLACKVIKRVWDQLNGLRMSLQARFLSVSVTVWYYWSPWYGKFVLDQWSWHYGLSFHIWISWTLTVMITDHNSSCYELIIIAMNWQQIMYENGDHSYELLLFIVWYFGSWLWNAFDHGWKKWSLLWTPLIMWSWLSYSCHHESYHDPYR